MAQFKQGDRVYTKSGHFGSYEHPMTGNRHQIDLDGNCPWVCPDDDLIPAHLVPKPATPPLNIVLSHQLARATDPRVLGWDKMLDIERERLSPEPSHEMDGPNVGGLIDPGFVPLTQTPAADCFQRARHFLFGAPRDPEETARLVALAQPGPIEIGTHAVPHGVQYHEDTDSYQVSVEGVDQYIRAAAARLRVGNPPGHYKRQRVYNAVTAACTPEQCSTVWDTFCEVEARIEARRSADPCTEPSAEYSVQDGAFRLHHPGYPSFWIAKQDVQNLNPTQLVQLMIGHVPWAAVLALLQPLQDEARKVLL